MRMRHTMGENEWKRENEYGVEERGLLHCTPMVLWHQRPGLVMWFYTPTVLWHKRPRTSTYLYVDLFGDWFIPSLTDTYVIPGFPPDDK